MQPYRAVYINYRVAPPLGRCLSSVKKAASCCLLQVGHIMLTENRSSVGSRQTDSIRLTADFQDNLDKPAPETG